VISASDSHIRYRIIGKAPVSNHQGDIFLTVSADNSKKTTLKYKIKFEGPLWLPDFILKFVVGRDINNAMKKLAGHFA